MLLSPALSIFIFVLVFFASAGLCRLFIGRTLFIDQVSARSSHAGVISRAGGMSLMLPFVLGATGLIVAQGISYQSEIVQLLMYSLLMTAIGFVDDRIGLSPLGKGMAQLIMAGLLVWQIGGIAYLPVPLIGPVALGTIGGTVLGVFFVVAFVNVFNFMDGLNGVASGTAIIASIAIALIAASTGRVDLFLAMACFTAAMLGFFIYNFPKGRVFMGDGGSLGAGFFLAGVALLCQRGDGGNEIGFLFVPIIFLGFILDVAVTLISRARRGQKLSEAHKEHIYQRMHQDGYSHANVALVYMGLAVCGAMTAFLNRAAALEWQWLGPVVFAALLLALMWIYFSADATRADEASD